MFSSESSTAETTSSGFDGSLGLTALLPPQVVDGCGLWIAPSTIPGAGLGMFTGRVFEEGEQVTPGDAIVPLVDMSFHTGQNTLSGIFLWDEYSWSKESFTGMEEEAADVYGASFGIGALPNCLFPAVGVEESTTRYDTAGLHRSRDPGIGAFTPYYGRQGIATRYLYEGEEIFVDYGYGYFEGDRIQSLGMIPFMADYEQADHLLDKLVQLQLIVRGRLQQKLKTTRCCDDIFRDLYGMITTQVSSTWPSRTLNALPRNLLDNTELQSFVRMSGTGYIFENTTQRSIDWLRENGSCSGHLRVQTSLIPQAGRGAFAIRDIPRGHVVAPVPLIQIPDRDILTMYLGKYNSMGEYIRDQSSPIHQQLLLNYCFGHPTTTLLLCPYGVVSNLINHSSRKANVRIEWNRQLSRNLDWLTQPIQDWAYTYRTGLVWDYIATRDIQAGEEIVLDYGREWERAWFAHVRRWKPIPRLYRSAWELNVDVDGILPIPGEQLSYDPRDVELFCRPEYRTLSGLPPWDEAEKESDPYLSCQIMKRSTWNNVTVYLVELLSYPDDETDRQCEVVVYEVLFSVIRDAFVFLDVMYTRDHAQPWSFRHDIQIPDHLLPEVWRNKV